MLMILSTIMLTLCIVAMITLLVTMPYFTCDWFNIFVKTKFMGYKKIFLYNGEHSFNEEFYTAIKTDIPPEHQRPYRYSATKCGVVRLYADGTAEYCGRYLWKYA